MIVILCLWSSTEVPVNLLFFHIECSLFCKESDSKAIYDVFEIFGSHLLTLMNVLTNSALTNVNRYNWILIMY